MGQAQYRRPSWFGWRDAGREAAHRADTGRVEKSDRGDEVMPQQATFRIWRGDRQGGAFQDYATPVDEGMVVLDAVHRIQANQAPDLAVRWNCKAGKCGSRSGESNGQPRRVGRARRAP